MGLLEKVLGRKPAEGDQKPKEVSDQPTRPLDGTTRGRARRPLKLSCLEIV